VVSPLTPYLRALRRITIEALERIGGQIARAERVFVMGNGGSAATANHFAGDLQRIGVTAISLCANEAIITRVGNDCGYETLFSTQLKEHKLGSKDVVIAISASGASKNMIRAVGYAELQEAHSIALTGFGGGVLARVSRDRIVLSSHDYGVVEGVHSCICHMLVDVLREIR